MVRVGPDKLQQAALWGVLTSVCKLAWQVALAAVDMAPLVMSPVARPCSTVQLQI